MFGKVKTIVLPGNDSLMKKIFTIEEYKEFSGIDLRDLLLLEDGYIDLNRNTVRNAQIMVEIATVSSAIILVPVVSEVVQYYDAGATDAITELKFLSSSGNIGGGIKFVIPKDKAFDISNLEVQVIEI